MKHWFKRKADHKLGAILAWTIAAIFIIAGLRFYEIYSDSYSVLYKADFSEKLWHVILELGNHLGTAIFVIALLEFSHSDNLEMRYFNFFGRKIEPLYHSLESIGVTDTIEQLDSTFFRENIQKCRKFTSVMTYIPGIDDWANSIRDRFLHDNFNNCNIYLLDPNDSQATLRKDILGIDVSRMIASTQDALRDRNIPFTLFIAPIAFPVYIFDDIAYIGFYPHHTEAHSITWLKVSLDGKLGKVVVEHVKRLDKVVVEHVKRLEEIVS